MSRPRSMFSRMRVELMSSRWVGSCSWMMRPEMQPRSAPISRPSASLERRKTMWFMEWTDPGTGAAL